MQLPSSVLVIPDLLNEQQLRNIVSLTEKISFVDGKATATGAAKDVKNNLQASREVTPEYQQVQQIVFNAVATHPLIHKAVMPKNILPPIISKYSGNMEYGWHTDSPIMTNQYTIRVDLSMTLFLNEPDTYEGGELQMHTPAGLVNYKLPAGHAVIYPTTILHRVVPVVSGERLACVTWLQSFVKQTDHRELLFQLKTVQESIEQKDSQSIDNLMLLQIYSNLMRMWSEI